MFYPSKGANLLPYRIEVSLGIRVRSLDYNCNYDANSVSLSNSRRQLLKKLRTKIYNHLLKIEKKIERGKKNGLRLTIFAQL